MARGDGSGVFQPEDLAEARTLEELSAYVQREFRRLSQAVALGWSRHMDPLHVAPGKPRDGDVAFADGTDWNPGSGVGAYIFYAAAWHPFGGGGGPGPTGPAGPQGPIGFALPGDDGSDAMPIPGPQGPAGPTGIGQIGAPGWIFEDESEQPFPLPGPMGPAGQSIQGPPGWLFQDDPEPVWPQPGPQGITGATGAAGPMGPMRLLEEYDQDIVPVGFNDTEGNPTAVTTPAVPATTVAAINSTGRDVTVYVKGGTLTVITVGGLATGIAAAAAANTAHTIPLKRNQSIAITFTVAPTWVWVGT